MSTSSQKNLNRLFGFVTTGMYRKDSKRIYVVSGATHFDLQLRAQQLLDIIAKFVDFADTELNTSKSFVTG